MIEELTPQQRGYYLREELIERLPSKEQLTKKPAIVIECIEGIPCNPCVKSCPVEAISKKDLFTPSEIDWNKCINCIKCVSACSALAIFMQQIKNGKGYVTLAYELLPEPKIGDRAKLMDRSGKILAEGAIVNPTYQVKGDKRWIVTVEMDDPDLSYDIRAIKIVRKAV